MARRLVQRRAAEEDVQEQLAYLAGDRPAVAHRYAIALEDAFARIRVMPEVGALRSYGARVRTLRVWPVPGFHRFLIFYRVTETTVDVIRVLHSARDVSRMLKVPRSSRTGESPTTKSTRPGSVTRGGMPRRRRD